MRNLALLALFLLLVRMLVTTFWASIVELEFIFCHFLRQWYTTNTDVKFARLLLEIIDAVVL